MQVLFSRCCGIDVHKDSVTACVLVYRDGKEPDVRKKEFATHFKALLNLKQWLLAQKVTHVAMESTGVYWKPVWQALEGSFQLILANPFQIKVMPGRKTDARDSQRIAELLAHGLIKPSFVPPQETRQLRDLTRYRVKLVEQRNRVHNRIHKVLEDACLKLDTVASDILGTSGRAMIQAIIAGQEHPDWLADKAKGRLRGKRPELRLAMRGRITEHHRLMLRELAMRRRGRDCARVIMRAVVNGSATGRAKGTAGCAARCARRHGRQRGRRVVTCGRSFTAKPASMGCAKRLLRPPTGCC